MGIAKEQNVINVIRDEQKLEQVGSFKYLVKYDKVGIEVVQK